MKRNDWLVLLGSILVFSPFFVWNELYQGYLQLNAQHAFLMSFVKFAILATFGEVLGLRIRSGSYIQKGFGIIPRAIVWGFLGLAIKFSFIVFATGVPAFLAKLGLDIQPSILAKPFSGLKLLTAFCISASMNTIFAPVMMTTHKITDTHILNTGGTIRGLLRPIPFGNIFVQLNRRMMWDFVFKKTIPLFWIPAHTITFLLPEDFRILFAAILGIVLGVLLAVADKFKK